MGEGELSPRGAEYNVGDGREAFGMCWTSQA